MSAVLLRLCDEDRESFDGPEWVRFNEADLDDLSFKQLHEIESELDTTLEFLLRVDKVARTARWTAAQVWLGRRMAGVETVPFAEFDIKVRKVQVTDEVPPASDAQEDDADPPSSSESSDAGESPTG